VQTPLILRLDVTGQPLRWIGWRTAVVLQAKSMIVWSAGQHRFGFYGGKNRLTGLRSHIRVSSIIAIKGVQKELYPKGMTPPLSNQELFLRDQGTCMYCGQQFPAHQLTRDHLLPISRGGLDSWNNVVTACHSCNHAKGALTPEEAGLELLAIPFVPNRAEYLVLSNRRILSDQMAFLKKRFRKGSRLQTRG